MLFGLLHGKVLLVVPVKRNVFHSERANRRKLTTCRCFGPKNLLEIGHLK